MSITRKDIAGKENENLAALPSKVDPADIKSNNMLLTDKEIKQVKKMFVKKKDTSNEFHYISKKKLRSTFSKKIKFSCVETEGQLYAIYHGKAKGKELAEGGYGVTKYAQNLNTGEWCVLKVQKYAVGEKQIEQQNREGALSKEAGLTIATGTTVSKNEKKGKRFKMLMKLVLGKELAKLRNTEAFKEISLNDRFEAAINILSQLDALHQKNIVHLDVHGGNMLMDTNMKVELLDFGKSQKYDPENDPMNGEYSLTQFEIDKKIDLRDAYNVVVDLLGMQISFSKSGGKEFVQNDIANFPDEKIRSAIAEKLLIINGNISKITVGEVLNSLIKLRNDLGLTTKFSHDVDNTNTNDKPLVRIEGTQHNNPSTTSQVFRKLSISNDSIYMDTHANNILEKSNSPQANNPHEKGGGESQLKNKYKEEEKTQQVSEKPPKKTTTEVERPKYLKMK